MSQLIHAVDWNGVTDTLAEDEAANWTFLQNSVQFKSDGPTKCTEYDKDGTVACTHKSTIFSQANSGIPNTWYLLDNQSTCDIVSNPKLVKNIRQVDGYMQLATQAGSMTTNWMADVPGYKLDGRCPRLPPACLVPSWWHYEHSFDGQHDREIPRHL